MCGWRFLMVIYLSPNIYTVTCVPKLNKYITLVFHALRFWKIQISPPNSTQTSLEFGNTSILRVLCWSGASSRICSPRVVVCEVFWVEKTCLYWYSIQFMWEFSEFQKFRRVKSFSGKSSIFPALLFRKKPDFPFHFLHDFTPVSLGCNIVTQEMHLPLRSILFW